MPVDNEKTADYSAIEDYKVPGYVDELAEMIIQNNHHPAKDVEQRNKKQMNSIASRFKVKDDVDRSIFFLLAYRIAKLRKPLKYPDFVETILKWVTAGNARYINHFPTSQATVENNLDSLLESLKNQGVVFDETIPKRGRIIAMLPVEDAEKYQAKKQIVKVIGFLQEEWGKVEEDFRFPLPNVKRVQNSVGANPQIYYSEIRPEDYIPENVLNELNSQNKVLRLKYNSIEDQDILILTDYYSKFDHILKNRMIVYLKKVRDDEVEVHSENMVKSRVNNLLREKFPNQKLTLTNILPSQFKLDQIFTEDDSNLQIWLHVVKDLIDNIFSGWRAPTLEQQALKQSFNIMYAKMLNSRNKQIWSKKKVNFKKKILDLIKANDIVSDDTVRQEFEQEMLEQKDRDDEELAGKRYHEFIYEFLNEHLLTENQEDFVTTIRINDKDQNKIYDAYVHSGRLLDLFMKYIDQGKHPQKGIRNRAFIQPLKMIIEDQGWVEDTVDALKDDKTFAAYLYEYVKSEYSEFFAIYHLFYKNEQVLLFLATLKEVKPQKFFNSDGTLKTFDQLFGFSRMGILKEIKKTDSFIDSIIAMIMSLLPFGKKKKSSKQKLIQIANKELGKSGGKTPSAGPGTNKKKKKNAANNQSGGNNANVPDPSELRKQNKERIKKTNEKIESYKKELLNISGYSSEKDYMSKFLQKWSFNPKDDERIIREVFNAKVKNGRTSRKSIVKKDFEKFSDVNQLLNYANSMATELLNRFSKKHIRKDDLEMYLAMYILQLVEKMNK